jgi:CubicO group peptidase (beta-lactamase class C family)
VLTRRSFIVRSLSGIATVYAWQAGMLVPTGVALATPAAQTSPPVEAHHGLTADQFQALVEQMIARGWRPIDVSGYDVGGQDYYATIWEQSGGPDWAVHHRLSAADHQAAFDALVGQGFRAVRVNGYGVGGQAMFASIWHRSDGRAWQARHGLPAGDYQAEFDALAGSGWRLIDVSGYEAGGQVAYTTVWDQFGGDWQARHGLSADAYQAAFNDLGGQGYRLVRVSGYPSGGSTAYAAIWARRDGPPGEARHGIPGNQYQGVFDGLNGQGYRPIQVCGYSAGGQEQFAGIWEQRPFTTGAPAGVDAIINDFMVSHGAPGLQIAIAKDDRLVFSAAYGYADITDLEQVRTDSRFRIASLTKALTSAAIFHLVEGGQLNLSDTVFGSGALLGTQYGTQPYGTGITSITVQHLLEHTAGTGWSNDAPDPMFLNTSLSQHDLISWVLDNRALVTTPGSDWKYSNFGYCVLGRVIEQVSGQSYEGYVQQNVLGPSGAFGMQIAGNTVGERKPGEVLYYVGDPYGLNVSRMDAHGGWIGSAVDLLRFVVHVDGFPGKPDILTAASISTMTTGSAANPGYAKGWGVNGGTWDHNGSLDGTATVMHRQADGFCWVVLTNASTTTGGVRLEGWLPGLVSDVLAAVPAWPNVDLF